MAIQLTPEQEQRLQAVVDSGAYPSTDVALAAALVTVERAAADAFDGTEEELECLLVAGLASKELSEEDFWNSVEARTSSLLQAH